MVDTQTIILHEDEMGKHPNNYQGWSREYAELAIIKALEKLKYENLKNLEFTSYACVRIDPLYQNSEACYVETKSPGYFFVMIDSVDHINVVYNRWD